MEKTAINELRSYVILTALNTAGVFQQNQKMRPLLPEEIDQLQNDILLEAQRIQARLTEQTCGG